MSGSSMRRCYCKSHWSACILPWRIEHQIPQPAMRSHSCASGHKTIAEAKLSWNFALLCQDLHDDNDKVHQMTGALLYTNYCLLFSLRIVWTSTGNTSKNIGLTGTLSTFTSVKRTVHFHLVIPTRSSKCAKKSTRTPTTLQLQRVWGSPNSAEICY